MSKRIVVTTLFLLTLFTTVRAQDTAPEVPALLETAPTRNDGATSAAIWLHPTDLSQSVILGTDDNAGIGIYDLSGGELQFLSDEPMGSVDLRYNFPVDDARITLVAASVKDRPQVALWTINPDTRLLERIGTIDTGIPANGSCMYLSRRTGQYYVFVNSEDGDVEQYLMRFQNGELTTTLAREFSVGSETEGCVADDELGLFYISEEEVALWRYGAEPEAGNNRRIVDIVGGNISEQVEGLTIFYGADRSGYLIAANESSNTFNLYERGGDNAFIGSFGISGGALDDRVTEPNGGDVIGLPLNDQFPAGLFVSADETNSNPSGRNNFKLASWGDIADALDLATDSSYDPRIRVDVAAAADVPTVTSLVETQPVDAGTDAADDPAIWVNPTDSELSVIIGTDKTPAGGLVVYNLDGSVHQFVPIGRVNNVDLRSGFMMNGAETTLVVATNRTENSMVIYALDAETRELTEVGAPVVSDMREVYGICMYQDLAAGAFYAFVNSANTGEVEQYLLEEDGSGRVSAVLVRDFVVGSQTEGCVVDDETGMLYVGEETVGIWRYGAQPDAGDAREMVDSTGADGNLIADVEGLAIYYAADGEGYLVASSQGSSEFVLYDRAVPNAYVGRFVVIETDVIDAVSGSDGLDVINLPLGAAFPDGALVVQDDLNLNPDGNQNFKIISWTDIAAALELVVDRTYIVGN
ncbi:MAG: phytase [Chloroflexota bacterium]|nr:phytase [Chloroflexota bacterium]